MDAILIREFVTSYDQLRPVRVPLPDADDSQVLVKVTHAAINYVDLLFARGEHQNNRLVRPPFVLGSEFSGVVVSAPAGSGLAPGDAVFGAALGAFATHVVVDPSMLRRVPPGWSFRDAAGLAATAPVSYGALAAGRLQAGETVLVHAAAGGLGSAAVQFALALGATVIATVGSPGKAKVLERLGLAPAQIIDYTQTGWEARVVEASGDGVDVVFDPVGLVEPSIRCCRYGGRIVVVGFAGRRGNLESIRANRILLKGVAVIGYRFGEAGRRDPTLHQAAWAATEALARSGRLRPLVYSEEFTGLGAMARAMQALADRQVWGKAVVTIADGQSVSKSKM